jgi:predicted ATPase/C4-dicarboxylate-specific signal transduction histidine kinase
MTSLSSAKLTLLRCELPELYRGVDERGRNAIFAMSSVSAGEGDQLASLRNEYSIRDVLSENWSLVAKEMGRFEDKLVLRFSDPGGNLLSSVAGSSLGIPQFLDISIALATAVSAMHAAGVVHLDLRPANILLSPHETRVFLIGFGCAIGIKDEYAPEEVERAHSGALEYMAPELCGRMARTIDARSDLYSVGCILYQLLVVTPPNIGQDLLAVAHAHQAREPISPSDIDASIPQAVNAIVLKLLEKHPDDRYQSASSLLADLSRCRSMALCPTGIAPFPLDSLSISRKASRGSKLFGRDRDLAVLSATFALAAAGAPAQTLFVSGYSGTGKSSLVRVWVKRIESPFLFATGICEQVNTMPFAALIQVLEQLVRPIIGMDENFFRAARVRMLDRLGNRGEPLWKVLPDLKFLLAEPGDANDEAIPIERSQFLDSAAKLLGYFGTTERPLVVFFDDLQWADEGTMTAFLYLVEKLDSPYVFIIGSYRSNEIGSDHPLHNVLSQSGKQHVHVQLEALDREDSARLVADTLRCSLDDASHVVDIVTEKTGGNPFFTTQFATELVQEGLIDLNSEASLVIRDLDGIRAKAYTDNVVDLLLRRIQRLKPTSLSALRRFACLGSSIAKAQLARSIGSGVHELRALLSDAFDLGLIYQSRDFYCFQHDRIRESAYASIPLTDRCSIHFDIAKRLMAGCESFDLSEDLFEIVSQLNFCIDEPVGDDERRRFAEANCAAGRRAREATAYTSALAYFATASAWLRDDAHSDLSLWLELYRADCECLVGALAPAVSRLEWLTSQSVSMELRAELTRLLAGLYTAQNRADLGMSAGLDFLRRLGLAIPDRPSDDQVDAAYTRLCGLIGTREIAELSAIATINDPIWRSAIDTLADLIPPALFLDLNLLDLILIQVATLSLEYGLCDASAFGFAFLNFIFGSRYGEFEKGYAFGVLSITVIDRFDRSRYKSRIYMRFGSLVVPWTRDWRAGLPYIEQAYQLSSELGNMVFNVSSARNVASVLMLAGAPLEQVEIAARRGYEISTTSSFSLYTDLLGEQLSSIEALRNTGEPRDPESTVDSTSKAMHTSRTSVSFTVWCLRLSRRFILGDISGALEAADRAAQSLSVSRTILEVIDFHFYAALANASMHRSGGKREDIVYRREQFENHFDSFSQYAKNCPENFFGRLAVLKAIRSEMSSDVPEAKRLFREAISHAQHFRHLHVDAIANELLSELHFSENDLNCAAVYLKGAVAAFTAWGATAKVKLLDAVHPGWVSRTEFDRLAIGPLHQLDVAAITRASQALSGEINFERLLETMVTTTLEHSGARRCAFISFSANDLIAESEARVSGNSTVVDRTRRNVTASAFPVSIIQAVVRTRRPMVLENASRTFSSNDTYVERGGARSIACIPLLKDDQLVAVIYLENDLVVGNFTEDKVAMLTVLGRQAAIALENARLYKELEVERRARLDSEENLRDALANLAHVDRLTTLGQLVNSIVQEITQPIEAMGTSVAAALRALKISPTTLPDLNEVKRLIRILIDDSARAADVVRSLREMAKKSPPNRETFDFNVALNEVLALLRRQFDNEFIATELQLCDDGMLLGDRLQIQHTALNLIVNAVEAMSIGAAGARRILIIRTERSKSDSLRITVSDTGPGVDLSIRDRIFEPFVTTKQAGMGMGLFICRAIVEAHGGQILLVNTTTQGACFQYELPRSGILVNA